MDGGVSLGSLRRALEETARRHSDYQERFRDPDGGWHDQIRMKVDHTARVVEEALALAKKRRLSDGETVALQAAALLHDVGRYQQFRSFGTYRDADSIDHAALGVAVIDALGLLERFDEQTRALVRGLVLFHNRPRIPERLPEEMVRLLALLRDADKLDIWRVILDMESSEERGEPAAAGLRRKLREREYVSAFELKSKADHRAFRLSWVFDLNADESCAEVLRREYVDRLFEKFPADDEHRSLRETMNRYLAERASKAA